MTDDIIEHIKQNVIQGRVDREDEGFNEGLVGQLGVKELVQQAVNDGLGPKRIVMEGLTEAMQIVGKKFEAKEYFIPDLLASAETVGVAMDILVPYLAKLGMATKGKIVLATVKGDIHDIGKNIVSIILKGAGYEVKDLGADVAPEQIVATVRKENPDFLGLSALLTTTMTAMKETIDSLAEARLRDKIKVIIGGAPTSAEFAAEIGADGYGADAFQALRAVEQLQQKSRGVL